MDEPPYTRSQFLADAQRQLVNTAIATLSDRSLEWAQVAPFLDAARSLCRDDLRFNAAMAIHGYDQVGTDLEPAEEAYLAISVRDRVDETEWLNQTFWLSELVLADQEPKRVRAAMAALERTLDKLRAWLAKEEALLNAHPPAAPEAEDKPEA